jgi:flagellar biosynthesis/type III secretory pathway protein FliH
MSLIIIESIVGFSIREGSCVYPREIAMLNRMDGWDRMRAETVLRIAEDTWDLGYEHGKEVGYEQGKEDSESDNPSYGDGYKEGYEEGYEEGVLDTKAKGNDAV